MKESTSWNRKATTKLVVMIGITMCALPVYASQNPIAGRALYTEPDSNAQQQAEEWAESRPEDAALMELIAQQPQAKWIGDWNDTPQETVKRYVDAATAAQELPVLVLYNIPHRDCGSYSAGGAESADAYRLFIDRVTRGIGENDAVVILEPDSVAGSGCLTKKQRKKRFALLADAVVTLKTAPATTVYIDAGHANWISESTMARRLKKAGIANADGFSLNVSNFYRIKRTRLFGKRLSARVGGKHFVIDTSRNGNGSRNGEWCNPPGRALGHAPTTETSHHRVDALLWVKKPGESDGECNGGPAAGEWWPEYALELAQNANSE